MSVCKKKERSYERTDSCKLIESFFSSYLFSIENYLLVFVSSNFWRTSIRISALEKLVVLTKFDATHYLQKIRFQLFLSDLATNQYRYLTNSRELSLVEETHWHQTHKIRNNSYHIVRCDLFVCDLVTKGNGFICMRVRAWTAKTC